MNKPASMPSTRMGGITKLLAILVTEVLFIVVLTALGSIDKMSIDFAHFGDWLNSTTPQVALVASIRILALAFSYWLLATSLIYMFARTLKIRGLIRAMEFATIPGVRKMIDAGLAAAIIGGTVFGGAGAVFARSHNSAQSPASPAASTRVLYNPTPASQDGPSTNLVNEQTPSTNKVVIPQTETTQKSDGTPNHDDQGHYVPTPANSDPTTQDTSKKPQPVETTAPSTSSPKVVVPSTEESTTTTTPKVTVPTPSVTVEGKQVQRDNDTSTPAPTDTSSTTGTSYTVVPGDNFWAIAKAHLQQDLGRTPTNAEVAQYWVKLIDANKSILRSGDPDLIFPGEVFTLPAI
jgi:hypothetical protein